MKKQMSMAFLIVISLTIASNYIGILKPDKLASSQNITISNEVVFSIPIGENGIHYEGSDNPDMLTWGPPAFTIAPDNTFWIADTPDNHILQFNSKGVLLSKIATENFIIGAGDLEVTSSEIWVLDEASLPPKVVRLSLDGKIISIHDLPKGFWLEDGLSGITLGSDGSVIIERIGAMMSLHLFLQQGNSSESLLKAMNFKGSYIRLFLQTCEKKMHPRVIYWWERTESMWKSLMI